MKSYISRATRGYFHLRSLGHVENTEALTRVHAVYHMIIISKLLGIVSRLRTSKQETAHKIITSDYILWQTSVNSQT